MTVGYLEMSSHDSVAQSVFSVFIFLSECFHSVLKEAVLRKSKIALSVGSKV